MAAFPIYRFVLDTGMGSEYDAHPLYGEGLEKHYTKESGEQFFRASLNGDLTFYGPDYEWIRSKTFEQVINLTIEVSNDAGTTWSDYYKGTFVKTDCEFNMEDKSVRVTPTTKDHYTKLLERINDEFDVIKLLPEIYRVNIDRRPMLQLYMPGTNVIGCYMGGQWWEQECEVVEESDMVEGSIFEPSKPKLTEIYHFGASIRTTRIEVTGDGVSPAVTGTYTGTPAPEATEFYMQRGNYAIHFWNRRVETQSPTQPAYEAFIEILDITTNPYTLLWQRLVFDRQRPSTAAELSALESITASPYPGSAAVGQITFTPTVFAVYTRVLTDAEQYKGLDTSPIPVGDMSINTKGYQRVIAYEDSNIVLMWTGKQSTPTEWGLAPDGRYYSEPPSTLGSACYPMCRKIWDAWSLWFVPPAYGFDTYGVQSYVLNNAYPLSSVIQKILAQIDTDLSYEPSAFNSQFFYSNPIVYFPYRLAITPKSNILSLGYDVPAMKGPITLRQIFDMLRDCFRCYWHIDDDGKLHIEHILYYRNGQDYTINQRSMDYDLRTLCDIKNGKPYATGQQTYRFEKQELPARYEFGWMDEVTEFFAGLPFEVVSNFVKKDNIESIRVSNFTTDVDYMMINPGSCSKDGFALLALTDSSGSAEPQYIRIFNEQLLPQLYPDTPVEVYPLMRFDNERNAEITYEANGAGLIVMETLGSSGNVTRTINLQGNIGKNTVSFILPAETQRIRFTAGINTFMAITEIVAFTGAPVVLGWFLPYYDFRADNGQQVRLLNGQLSFQYLQNYYAYDMPARYYIVGETTRTAYGMKRTRTHEVKFPALTDPNPMSMIGTFLGIGEIADLVVNLSSRNCKAKLLYDTE